MINLRLWPNYSKKKNFCSLKLEIFKLALIGTLRAYGAFEVILGYLQGQ